MKNKYSTTVFCLILTMLSSFTINAQPIKPKQLLKKVDASVSNIQTVTYKINYSNKFSSNKDTIHRAAICTLSIDNKDETKNQFILSTNISDKYHHYLYDAIHGASISYHKDSLKEAKRWTINNDTGVYNRATNGTLLLDYFGGNNLFRESRSIWTNLLIKNMEIKEIVHLNEPAYLLTIYTKKCKNNPQLYAKCRE